MIPSWILVKHVLLSTDYDIDARDTFAAGPELLRLRRYDLVIADDRLRDGTGMMLADDAQGPGAALIITGAGLRLPRPACVNLVQHAVLLKPISPEELPNGVEKALQVRS